MSIKTNYHTHSYFCDGKGQPEEYVRSAIEKGMTSIGFSGHSPVPFPSSWNMKLVDLPNYLAEIQRLKDVYQSEIQIYSGLEVDFIEGVCSIADFDQKLDYYIGSVHYLKQFDDGVFFNFDESASRFDLGIQQIFGGSIKEAVNYYFGQLCWMIENYQPPIIGHLDLIKKFNTGNRYFDENEKWFVDAATPVLELAKKHELVVEINTKGKARGADTLYPGPSILKRCLEMNVLLTVSADAHNPSDMCCLYESVELLFRYLGIREIMVLDKNRWISANIW